MIWRDIWTVARKELQELFAASSKGIGSIARLLIWVGFMGILLPLQAGVEVVTSPAILLTWTWFPMFIVASVIAGVFAGERERHTLETLLASRLSDRAILYGKIVGGVIYGWGLTLTSIVLSLITINVAFAEGQLLFYPLLNFVSGLVTSLLGALLASGAGVLVSLRAPTARQAQQSVSLAMMLLFFVPMFTIQALPDEVNQQLVGWLLQINIPVVILVAIVIMAVLSVIFLLAAQARFQRHKLILD